MSEWEQRAIDAAHEGELREEREGADKLRDGVLKAYGILWLGPATHETAERARKELAAVLLPEERRKGVGMVQDENEKQGRHDR